MQNVEINAETRTNLSKGTTHALRRQGMVPGVCYGDKKDPITLVVSERDLNRAVSGELGMNTLLKLKIKDGETLDALVRDYQAHPIKRNFMHVDFQRVDPNKEMTIEVPVVLEGKSVGVKEGGILDHVRRTLNVRCRPTHIPKEIKLDISALNIGDTIHISDIKLPEGTKVVEGDHLTIVTIASPSTEEATAATDAATAAQPVVIADEKKAARDAQKGAAPAGDKKAADKGKK
jgi:large subunit ribosomal protein L25